MAVNGTNRVMVGCLIAAAALFSLSMAGGIGAFVYLGLLADMTLHVVNESGTARVLVDGQVVASIDGKRAETLKLARGPRDVVVEWGGEQRRFAIEAVGLDDLVLPTNPDTCIAIVDVAPALYQTDSSYERHFGDGTPARALCDFGAPPRLSSTLDAFPVDIGGVDVRLADLPETVSGNAPVFLTLPFPCADVRAKGASSDAIDAIDAAALLRRFLECA